MTKKDRIAIVVSALYSLFPMGVLANGKPEGFLILIIPVLLYWGYRFIQGDISFIGNKYDQ